MKPNNAQLVHHVQSDEMDSVRMSLDADSITHLMQLLTDLYSNPILAFIREYATNALDSHIDAGVDEPILITLPNSVSPHFIVQDFGTGLDVDDLTNVYSMYGKSTKRESDAVTGTLGLGCKSGLTYALSFTVTAVKHGLKTHAVVTKDDDGVGIIKIMDTSATEERNGVTVSIPIKNFDIDRVRNEATAFFKYWRKGTVLVDGNEPTFLDEALWIDEDVAVLPRAHESRIVMGNVPYPIGHRGINGVSIIAWVPMGSVNFTPSREALHFTPRTEETVATLQDFVQQTLPREILKAVNAAKTPYEQLLLADRWGPHGQRILKGHSTRVGYMKLGPGKAWQVYRSSSYSTNTGLRATSMESVQLRAIIGDFLVITDFPYMSVSRGHRSRLESFGALTKGTGESKVLILPEKTDLRYLKGRKNVVTWQHIVDKTPTPPKSRGGGSKTQYLVFHNGTTYSTDLIDTDDPILYTTTNAYYIRQFPEAHTVEIKERQVDRFERLHPTAIRAHVYQQQLITKYKAELTDEDRLWFGLERSKYACFKGMADRLDDPLLRTVIKMTENGYVKSKALQKLIDWNATSDIRLHSSNELLKERYPLLYRLDSYYRIEEAVDDIVLYLNTKYQTIREDEE